MKIDVKRLLEVLDFKYFKVNGVKHWKIHGGGGMEFGNRQSTFVSLNILNNEFLFMVLSSRVQRMYIHSMFLRESLQRQH